MKVMVGVSSEDADEEAMTWGVSKGHRNDRKEQNSQHNEQRHPLSDIENKKQDGFQK